ncbi:glucosylceramidase-like isoform X1 [Pseudomyrmex gracilis]|uniref:glucosylceramidase-like isoform X1 n=1 Tax=Pseudomyrmex gracilis TaxID=219809 RepID=UPI000994FA5B|nr:glucosylceramidase-like isoform X1 [Pseudomyrmex gracilis]
MLRVLILIATFVAVKGDNCVPKLVEKDKIVCVCNSTYCDSPEQSTLNENQFAWYMSTKDGKRMQLSVSNFTNTSTGRILTVDKNKTYQTIFGFGGAMTDAAALNIRSLSNSTQQNLLEAYYGANGIGYTVIRIPIAGTDFSVKPYTYDDVPGDIKLNNFSLVEEDDYKIEYLHNIKKIMPENDILKIFTTAWSAPAWMKTTNETKWGTLKEEYYQLYAEYWKKFFDAYKTRGIDIWGVTPGNEPFDGFVPFFSFNSMGWTPISGAKWTVDYLNSTLSKAGYNPVYMLMDDQRFALPWFVDLAFKSEPRAETLFNGIAYHWYFNNIFSPRRLTDTHDKYPNKFILMTEACEGSQSFKNEKVILGSWERGNKYILDIIDNLNHWVVGWIDWNIALDMQGGPNWAKNYVDSPIIINATNDEFYKEPMFYALAHVSKFVPRGSIRISAEGIEDELIKTVAFLTPENKIVVPVVNKGDEPFDITIKDKSTNNMLKLRLPPNSFNTILYLSQ